MFKFLAEEFGANSRFLHQEDGAVTVDFVVLTAALATLGLVVLAVVNTGVYEAASDIGAEFTRSWK